MTASPAAILAIAVSRKGSGIARRLGSELAGVTGCVPARFAAAGERGYEGSVRAVVEDSFRRGSALVLVMATGIAVRLVAPLLAGKESDPAVVVVDDAGRFAISLVSGHLGGANRLAERVAAAIGALPVITTASEAAGMPALDLLGREDGWRLDPASDLTAVTAALVNGEAVGVLQACGDAGWLPEPLPDHVTVYPTLELMLAARPAAAVVIDDRAHAEWPNDLPRLIYHPRTLVVGVGTSRGAPPEEVQELFGRALSATQLAGASVGAVATIDRRRDEPAVAELGAWLGVPVLTYTAAELDAAPGVWTPSQVVLQAVGTRGVCEPAALLAAGSREPVVTKLKSAHATVAIARVAAGLQLPCGASAPSFDAGAAADRDA